MSRCSAKQYLEQHGYPNPECDYEKELLDAMVEFAEKENKQLREFEKNWQELKTQLVFTVENYDDDDFDNSIAHKILDEMSKLEKGGE